MRLSLLVVSVVFAAGPALAAGPIDGRWITEGGKAEVTIAPCGGARCGHVSKILAPTPKGPPHDDNNSDKALRRRPILGIGILSGLTPDGDEWRGHVYSPDTGKTYRSIVARGDAGTLKVKGCLAMFCKTQIWKRAR